MRQKRSDRRHPLRGIALNAIPALTFVAAFAVAGLCVATALAMFASLAVGTGQWFASREWRKPLVGCIVALLSAGAVLATGEARAFFLVPMAIPLCATVACALSLVFGAPLAGVLLHRLDGGGSNWKEVPPLLRVYTEATVAALATSIANVTSQAWFYATDNVSGLAIVHVAVPLVFAGIVAHTVRRARIVARRAGDPVGHG